MKPKVTLKNKRGITLIVAYMVLAVILVLTATSLYRATAEAGLVKRNRAYLQAFYLAESAISEGAYQLSYREANYLDVNSNNSDIAYAAATPGFTVTYGWTDLFGAAADTNIVDPQGIVFFLRRYQISATAVSNEFGISVTLNQIVSRRKTYTFQHAVFYEDDLEVLPGVNMNFSGRIHGNHDIYLGTHASLTVNSDYLYSAGNIYNRRKDSAQDMLGSVNIKVRGSDPAVYELMKKASDTTALDCDRSDWIDESQLRWNGTVKSSVHGVNALATPAVGSIQPDGFYSANAGIKIVDTAAYDSSGNLISFDDDNPISVSTFYDAREGRNVTVTNIDMGVLAESGYYPANGLLYATRTDASSAQPNGIRLVNGSELAARLTVVSNDPVYVRGDYNNVNKKPAAIIGDTLNILSNNWNDTTPVSSRVASTTTVNSAFIAGIKATPDGGGVYSGGLENYPRLLENWTGKNLNIRGSFIELWFSQIAQGNWVYGMPRYTAPGRNWDYDTSFNNSANLPPFTPFAVETERVAWWKS
ncbi:MAG: hypothetical protein PHS09_00280 [Candidatus Omnitrophica bacterium]|nr:hypothetical protein [Candidatus Omnitrophota bacterium]MDD5512243.1 hypothetical protein [Candidatus Omnitrophota bacterium]